MATCRECLLYEKCVTRMMSKQNMFGGLDDLEHDCDSFKSKSDYVKREHGKWIFSHTYNHTDYYRCSVCGYVYPIFTNTRFCQHCSADMRKEDNNA